MDFPNDLAGGGLHVIGLKQVGNDDDAAGSGGEDLRQGLAGDATDAEGGDLTADFALHGGDFLKADGRAAGFGGSREKRAEADVVEAFGEGGAGLAEGMGGAADEFAGADDFAGGGERAVVLAEVDAVGIEGGGEGGEIVENEGNRRRATRSMVARSLPLARSWRRWAPPANKEAVVVSAFSSGT